MQLAQRQNLVARGTWALLDQGLAISNQSTQYTKYKVTNFIPPALMNDG